MHHEGDFFAKFTLQPTLVIAELWDVMGDHSRCAGWLGDQSKVTVVDHHQRTNLYAFKRSSSLDYQPWVQKGELVIHHG